MSAGSKADVKVRIRDVHFTLKSGHGPVKRVCKPNCKPTAQHSLAQAITKKDYRVENAKLEHTLSHLAAQASMRIIELENRCTGNRTVGSNPTLSPISWE